MMTSHKYKYTNDEVKVLSTLPCIVLQENVHSGVCVWEESYLYQNMLINQRHRWLYYLKKQSKIKQVTIVC